MCHYVPLPLLVIGVKDLLPDGAAHGQGWVDGGRCTQHSQEQRGENGSSLHSENSCLDVLDALELDPFSSSRYPIQRCCRIVC